MKFKADQIAFYPPDPDKAIELLTAMGATDWAKDIVDAKGKVFSENDVENTAELAFNYQLGSPREFEVLSYRSGRNWMDNSCDASYEARKYRISHIGMHVTAMELIQWREFFTQRGITVAQEVMTTSHTNPLAVMLGRHYNYVIFDTYAILGVDLKFIVRI